MYCRARDSTLEQVPPLGPALVLVVLQVQQQHPHLVLLLLATAYSSDAHHL